MSWIQKLQVNSSQCKNHFTVIFCPNITSFAVWLRKEANLKCLEVNHVSFLIWSHTGYLFWVTHALWHFELSHYGLDVMIIVQIPHCVGGNLTYFYLGPKTEIDCLDLRFTFRSKIHVFSSTILKVLLILVPNRNCVRKSLGLIWPILEITSHESSYLWSNYHFLHTITYLVGIGKWRARGV